MKTTIFAICLIALAAIYTPAQKTDDKTAALAVVNQLFAEMAAANPAGIVALHTPDSQLAAIRKMKDGSVRLDVIGRDVFSKFFTEKTPVVFEDLYDPKVEVSGDWAMVWGRYVFFVGDKISHCGIDEFNLVRTAEGWRIANGASTIDPGACTESEKARKARPLKS